MLKAYSWKLIGRISKHVALLMGAEAFGLSSALLENQRKCYQDVLKLHCGIFQHEIDSATALLSVTDMSCNL